MPPSKFFRYLLVLLDTFLGWVEDFHITNEKSETVSDHFFREIILHFGVPTSLPSGYDPEFTSQVSQTLVKPFNIPRHSYIGSLETRLNKPIYLSKTFLSNSPKNSILIG